MNVDKSIKYTQWILRGAYINKYKQILAGFKELVKGLDGDQYNLGVTEDVAMKQLCVWTKVDSIEGSGDLCLCPDRCSDFDKEL